ncbi:hypothetical protein ACTJIJ_19990 [Niabella sp. 22666]|uniref:hypothetical protein n=1 Tax=Niabella sp. 22666 TaxID=3453954 RepID=UPI003F8353C6
MAKSYSQLKNDINSKIRNKTAARSILKGDVSDVTTDIVDKIEEVATASGGTPITGAASSIVSSNLPASRVVVSDGGGKVTNSSVTVAQLNSLPAQGALASTAVQPGQNISTLNNNAGYQNALQVLAAVNGAVDRITSITTIEGIFPSTSVDVVPGTEKAVRPTISGPYTGLEGGSTITISQEDFDTNLITFYYDGAEWLTIRQPISNDARPFYTNSDEFRPTRDTVLLAKESGDYDNLQTSSGAAAPTIVVNPNEVAGNGIYSEVQLQYNLASDSWTKVLIEKRSGVNEPFTELSGSVWDWSFGRNKSKTLTANSSINIINNEDGEAGFLEVQSGGFSLIINGQVISTIGATTSVGIMSIGKSLKFFVDNSSIKSEGAILSAAGGLGSGPVGFGSLSDFRMINTYSDSRVTTAGTARKIRFYINAIPTSDAGDPVNSIFISVWRTSGETLNRIWQQEILISSLVVGVNTITVASPPSVMIDDYTSMHWLGSMINQPFSVKDAGVNACIYGTDAPPPNPFPWTGSVLNSYFPIQLIDGI